MNYSAPPFTRTSSLSSEISTASTAVFEEAPDVFLPVCLHRAIEDATTEYMMHARERVAAERNANEAIDRRVAELVIDSDEVERDVVFGNVFGNVFDEHPMPIDDAWTSGYDRPISDDRCLHGSVAGVSCLIDSSMADDRALERSVADFSDSEITKMMQDGVVNDFIVKVMGDDKL